MDACKRATLSVRIEDAHNIDLVTETIAAEFETEVYKTSPTQETNLTTLFRIKSGSKSLPSFVIRWDDKARAVDVDPDPFEAIARNVWRREKNGYRGHHAKQVSENPRVHEVEIHIPGSLVFKGLLQFNIGIGVRVEDAITLGSSCDAIVIKGSQ